MPGETVLNGNQEWVVQADLPLTAAIRQSQQTLYHSHPPHPADRQGESWPHLHCGASRAASPVSCSFVGRVWGGSQGSCSCRVKDGPQTQLDPRVRQYLALSVSLCLSALPTSSWLHL